VEERGGKRGKSDSRVTDYTVYLATFSSSGNARIEPRKREKKEEGLKGGKRKSSIAVS